MGFVVAVDGPSGAGKSSVSREVARILGAAYLDTGAMYRSFTWWCLRQGVDLDSMDDLLCAISGFELEISTDPNVRSVGVGGVDVTKEIRASDVSAYVSRVSGVPVVRKVLVSVQQRQVAAVSEAVIVVEGRDISSVVVPDADLKIFLTARESVRVGRRREQVCVAEGSALTDRDAQDALVTGFDPEALGVWVLDSSDMSFEGTVAVVLDRIRALRVS